MGDVRVDGPASPCVQSPEEMIGRFQAELISALPAWKERVTTDPGQLEGLERDVQQAFSRGAGLLIAGLIAQVLGSPQFAKTCEKTRTGFHYPLAAGRTRRIPLRLLSGLVIWISSLYCEPRKSWFARTQEKAPGTYIELAQFGFGKGCSPGLQSKVARTAVLSPSLQLAQKELKRDGVTLDVKTVRRIALQCGESLLRLRTLELEAFREGTLPAGTELKGKRVSVQIDGGRTRIRGDLRAAAPVSEAKDADGLPCEDAPGRSQKRPSRTFDADWREPKLMTIFIHDETGRMAKKSQATIDGTFQGPDAMAELVAMHLHRLGATQAKSVTFVADGGTWIWNRIDAIVRMAQLQPSCVHEVLDCYHAAHHISLALAALGYGDQQRLPLYREHRTLLRNGQWRRVVEELTELAGRMPEGSQVWTEIAYLKKHGEAGRLKYPTFRKLGLPLGSGAIESGIRRVINLRLKGNSIYWREASAESMLQIRAQVLTDRWDERMKQLRKVLSLDARTDWQWTPRNMSPQAEGDDASANFAEKHGGNTSA
jgi:hypothetical protein